MKIFLDDYRTPLNCISYMHQRIGALNTIYLQEWVIVKNYDDFVNMVSKNADVITHISFDHDLADEHYISESRMDSLYDIYQEKTGYDCAKWVKDFYLSIETDLPIMFVHSMNPVGTQNIINLLNQPK